MNELPTPPDATGDPAPVELLRVWVIGQTLQCTIQADAFPDVGAWGEVLADVVRHIARAGREQEGMVEEETVRRILAVFDEEMRSPTTE
jgi:hypothetical protein